MPEREAWTWIFTYDRTAREKKTHLKSPEICFTGFTDSERERLCEVALTVGFAVKDSVTKNLLVLVTGENAGPSKVAKAEKQNCIITDRRGFMDYVRTKTEE